MIRILLALAIALPLTACLGPSRSPGRVGGTVMAVTGLLLVTDGATTDCSEGEFGEALGCALGAGAEAGIGTMLITSAITLLLINELRDLPPRVEEPPPRVYPIARRIPHAEEVGSPMTVDPLLRRLTLQAAIAARAGHCSAVDQLADRVAVLDPSYRHAGFVTDRAIVACIDR